MNDYKICEDMNEIENEPFNYTKGIVAWGCNIECDDFKRGKNKIKEI